MKKKIVSLLLSLSLIATAVMPASAVMAEGSETVNAPAALQATDDDKDGLFVGKTTTDNGDGTYTISMEAYTNGEVKTEVKDVPLDIVLVLDQSGSMADPFGNTNRQQAMKDAVNNFIDKVAQKYDAKKADHRISIVTFASGATKLADWTKVDEAGNNSLQGAINNLKDPVGATNAGAGMQQAADLMNQAGYDKERNQIVIMFTDGVPTTNSDFDTGVANTAIRNAKTLKDNGATVFSVGIFNGAKPGELYGDKWDYKLYGDIPCTGEVGSYWGGSWLSDIFPGNDFVAIDVAAGNRFLNYLSNNFISADRIGVERDTYNPGGHWAAGGTGYKITQNFPRNSSDYYLTASDPDGLNKVFETIENTISTPAIDLGANTVIKDVVTPYFNMPANVSDIKLYTAPYNGTEFGEKTPASGVKASINGNTVSVTGFDFNKNFISQNPKPGTQSDYGSKLIIEFTVTRKAGFIGGNQVPTNEAESGVYAPGKDEAVDKFPVPTVDVPIQYNYTTSNQEIFVGETADLAGRIGQIDPYTLNGTNNAFVNITYTVKDPSGKVVGTYTVNAGAQSGTWTWIPDEGAGTPALTENTEYNVVCNVTPLPVEDGQISILGKVIEKKFTISVKSGTLTIQKNGGQENERYIFNIQKDEEYYMTVTTTGDDLVKITQLPKGEYTVTEETAWSWRYQEPQFDNSSVTISSENQSATVTCTNKDRDPYWLNGYSEAINRCNKN